MKKISIIVPAFNVEKYIRKCLDSLINQTLKDIEIICIDDASQDETKTILKEYEKKDERIQIIYHKHNQGLPTSRNDGLKIARGKYIAFVDADDYVDFDGYEKLYDFCEQYHLELGFFHYRDIYETDDVVYRDNGKISNHYEGIYNGRALLKLFLENKDFFYFAWAALFNREFLFNNNLFFKNMGIGESGEYMLRNILIANRVAVSDYVIYNYFQREKSIMHTEGAKGKLLFGQIIQYMTVLKLSIDEQNEIGMSNFLQFQKNKIHGGLQSLSEINTNEIKDSLYDIFEKHVFQLLCEQKERYEFNFSKEMIKKISNNKNIIIYGAGYATPDLIEYLNKYNVEILGIAVSDKRNNPESIYGHHVYEIQELKHFYQRALVIVAANIKYKVGISKLLNEMKFSNVIFLNITF